MEHRRDKWRVSLGRPVSKYLEFQKERSGEKETVKETVQ